MDKSKKDTCETNRDIYYKTALLLGENAVQKLKASRVAVIGLGGVGYGACEALARSGVGELFLFDFDTVSETNRNRQLIALESTTGMKKTQAALARIRDINAECIVHTFDIFIDDEALETEDIKEALTGCDAVIDAIDTVSSKAALALFCERNGLYEIASMGTGNKTDVTRLKVCDIYSTNNDPLAKAVRSLLKKNGVKKLKTVFSDELPAVRPDEPASMIFVPLAAGLMLARECILHITGAK